MRMIRHGRTIALVMALAALGACAQTTDRTSPCVCNWEPANADAPSALA